ncbi:integrase core domain-containing protein [Dialister succinatiphilus]|uniref:integrase core domain-containing protein n=1 Tax=Dialister succinatiphilus TaxID=487173 RepID=UPI004026140E
MIIEQRFRSFKIEQIYTYEYGTPRELRRLIAACIEKYIRVRPHEALDYETPDELYYRCFAS